MQSWLVELLEMSGAGNQGRDQGPEFGHQLFPSAPESMSVEPGCWRVLGEQVTGPACEVVFEQSSSEREEGAETPENCSLVQLQNSPWGGLQ